MRPITPITLPSPVHRGHHLVFTRNASWLAERLEFRMAEVRTQLQERIERIQQVIDMPIEDLVKLNDHWSPIVANVELKNLIDDVLAYEYEKELLDYQCFLKTSLEYDGDEEKKIDVFTLRSFLKPYKPPDPKAFGICVAADARAEIARGPAASARGASFSPMMDAPRTIEEAIEMARAF